MQHLRDWIGRTQTLHDVATVAPLAGLMATLDWDKPLPPCGAELPPLAHWLYFTPRVPQSRLGLDGHAQRGEFLPPVPLPRRMWAGGRLAFLHPLRVGDALDCTTSVIDVTIKQGRSGALVFVTVRHEIANAQGVAVTEEHDIVYREAPSPGAAVTALTPAPRDETFARAITPDATLLFRYSALTFNGHRIHYDRNYATEVEGYPGLVVHGPLVATLLVDLLHREHPASRVARFEFTALRPLFDTHPFTLCGKNDGASALGHRRMQLWARDHEGHLAMRATAEIT